MNGRAPTAPPPARPRRRGVTLMEIMVVLVIMAGVTAVVVPSTYALFDLEQRGAARDLAQTYKFLIQEATMRNVTFRIAYNLTDNSYQIEMGDADTLVFGNPEARRKYEDEQERKLKMFTKEDRDAEAQKDEQRFGGLDVSGFEEKVGLPSGSAWGFVYTPQYPEPQRYEETKEEDAPPQIVYSYIFSNGEAEYTVVRVVSQDDPEDGYSIEVEPVSGRVRVESELIEAGQSLDWLPADLPTFH